MTDSDKLSEFQRRAKFCLTVAEMRGIIQDLGDTQIKELDDGWKTMPEAPQTGRILTIKDLMNNCVSQGFYDGSYARWVLWDESKLRIPFAFTQQNYRWRFPAGEPTFGPQPDYQGWYETSEIVPNNYEVVIITGDPAKRFPQYAQFLYGKFITNDNDKSRPKYWQTATIREKL